MARRRSAVISRSVGAAKRPVAGPARSRSVEARRGALLGTIREGTPLAVLNVLRELEENGHIRPYDDIVGDEVEETDLMLQLDSEIDLSDEDVSSVEDAYAQPSTEDAGSYVLGSGFLDKVSGLTTPSAFELVVRDGVCSVIVPEWTVRNAVTATGEMYLYELGGRIRTLRGVAEWLTKDRVAFLQSHDVWDLGCSALSEAADGKPSVVQKWFLQMSSAAAGTSAASFSRHIRECRIVWPNGSAAVQSLFGKYARMAWVARAVRQFVEQEGSVLTKAILHEYETVAVSRGKGSQRLARSVSLAASDLPTFIKRVNALADTKWRDVIEQFGNQMLEGSDGW